MRRTHATLVTAALLIALVALNACDSGSGPTPPPSVPNATSITPTTAQRGDTITISGNGFGATEGTVSVGGATAAATDWTPTSITAIVPAGTPNAWQTVTVTTAGGSDTLDGLFVGTEFTGTATQLQSYLHDSEPGTAVLLQARSYDLSTSSRPFVIDTIDLYGRGAANTSITLPSEAHAAIDFGATTTIADLTMRGTRLDFLAGTLRDTMSPFAVRPASSPRDAVDQLDALRGPFVDAVKAAGASAPAGAGASAPAGAAAGAQTSGIAAAPFAAPATTLVLDGVVYEEAAPGLFGGLPTPLPNINVVIRDSTIDVPTSVVTIAVTGSISLEDSDVTAAGALIATPFGAVSLEASLFSSSNTGLVAQAGLSVVDSTVRATGSTVTVLGAGGTMLGGATQPSGGPIEFRGSVLEALDTNLTDANDLGFVVMNTMFAPIRLIDNVRLRSHDDFSVATLDANQGEGDIEVRGNADVRVGVFSAESVVRAANLTFITSTGNNVRNRTTLEGNTIGVTGTLIASNGGAPGDVEVRGNTITAGDADTTGIVSLRAAADGALEVTDNIITSGGVIDLVASDLGGGTLLVADNTLTVQAVTDAAVNLAAVAGSCVITDNTITATDPDESFVTSVEVICTAPNPGSGHTMVVTGNDVVATGKDQSNLSIFGFDLDAQVIEENSFETVAGFTIGTTNADVSFARNQVELTRGGLLLGGLTGGAFTVSDNDVVQHELERGLIVSGLTAITLTDNTFTRLGTPPGEAIALTLAPDDTPMTATVTGNTFSGYTHALHLAESATPEGLAATINGNVFDFTIDAAPKVADLENIKDQIDARDNQWGSNTSLATVESYVTLSGDTITQGGSILLDPIRQP